MPPFPLPNPRVVVVAMATLGLGVLLFVFFVPTDVRDDVTHASQPLGNTVLLNTQELALDRFQDDKINAHGVILDANIDVGQLSGRWRNDTGNYVFLTGLYAEQGQEPDIQVQVGDRNMTGGIVKRGTIVTEGTTNAAPTLTWPGSQPVPPGAVVTTTLSAVDTVRYNYTAVVAPRFNPQSNKAHAAFLFNWPEPRWFTIESALQTGQQTPSLQTGFEGVAMDFARGNSNVQFLTTTLLRLHIDSTPVTLNAVQAKAIPGTVFRPDAILGIPFRQGATFWLYIDVNTVASNPAITYRCVKKYGTVG